MFRDFFLGLSAPLRALRLLGSVSRLRRLAAMPFLINLLLFLVGVPLAVWGGVTFIGGLLPGAELLQGTLRVLLQVLIALAVIVGSAFAFTLVGNIIAAPFNSKLSEAVEEHVAGRPAAAAGGIVGDAVRGIITAIGRLFLFLLLYPLVFALQFIPVAGPFLHAVFAALYGAFVLSIDFSDPTFERHFRRFRDKVGFIWGHRALYLGFGLTAVAMAIVPFVNFLLLPVCVTAAAMLYLEKRREELSG